MTHVDVIIPTRNRFHLTKEAIDSVRSQGYSDWMLWVADDASDDGSVDELQRVYARDPRVRILREPKRGASLQRQHLLERTHAPWIALLDSDDLWLPTKLEKQVAASQDADVVLTWFEWFRPDGSVRKVGRPEIGRRVSPLATNNVSMPLIRREWLLSRGGFAPAGLPPLTTCEHTELFIRLLLDARVTLVPEVLTRCRDHSGPRSSESNARSRGAHEMAAMVRYHETSLANWPKEFRQLQAATGARMLAAGDRVNGYQWLWQALKSAPTTEKFRLLRRFGPLAIKKFLGL